MLGEHSKVLFSGVHWHLKNKVTVLTGFILITLFEE